MCAVVARYYCLTVLLANRVPSSGMARLRLDLLVAVAAAVGALRVDGRARSSAAADGRGCVYSFQVWTPNQDVLAKLRRLEQRCDSVSSSVDHEVRVVVISGHLIFPQNTRCSTHTYHSLGDRSFVVAGPRVWNSLPATIRQITSYGRFRQHLKTHFYSGPRNRSAL